MVRNNVWGGGERYVFDLCNRSVINGDDITVVSRGISEIDNHFRELSVDLVKAPLGGIFDFISPWRLARLILSYPDDMIVIHVHTFKDAEIVAQVKKIVGKRKKIRLVCTRHLVKPGKSSLRWRSIYKAIDKLIFVSAMAEREFLLGNPPIDEQKLKVIHNSIVVPEKYSLPVDSPDCPELNLLYIGRISPEKGIDTLIRAIATLPDLQIRLKIVGTGSDKYEDELKTLARALHVDTRIEWPGFVSDVFLEIREANCCIFPSRWKEPFGLTIIEAMSQKRLVITTNNGAQPEIITDGEDGILVNPDHERQLALAIRSMAERPMLRKNMSEKAFNTFNSRFSYDIFFSKIQAIYRETL